MIVLLFPQYCLLCNEKTDCARSLCAVCEWQLPWLGHNCRCCARPLTHLHAHHCGICLSRMPPIDQTWCCFHYQSPIKQWISQYKFNQQLHFQTLFTHWLYQKILSANSVIDVIIAVPIHRKRLKQRGFNQCVLIARALAKLLNLRYEDHLLIRHQHTAAQMTLPAKLRQKNIRGCFQVTQPVEGLKILIIEDIITTGSTIIEAAKTLKASGANAVTVLAIARASEHDKA